MSTASFIAFQRTGHAIPCALEVPPSTLCAQLNRTPSPTQQRRAEIDTAVAESFDGRDLRVAEDAHSRTCAPKAGGCRRRPWRSRWPARACRAAGRSAAGA